MGVWKKVLLQVTWTCVLAFGFSGAVSPASAQQVATAPSRDLPAAESLLATAEVQPKSAELPDSPGATLAKSEQATSQQNTTAQSQSQSQMSQSPQQEPSSPQRPVGTAAAEAPNASGIAASQPAGVAIAPAKQHRARTIVLRVGAIVGAGVAVGSVIALTAATSSKPPGAH